MSRATDLIDTALDDFFAFQVRKGRPSTVRRFKRQAIAVCTFRVTGVRPPLDEVSQALQSYIQAQEHRPMRYRIAAREYARGAKWYVLDGPNLDPLVGESLTMAHIRWVIEDLAGRAARDARRELFPASMAHPAIDQMVIDTAGELATVLEWMVKRARTSADLYTKLTGRMVEMVPAETPSETQLYADLATTP